MFNKIYLSVLLLLLFPFFVICQEKGKILKGKILDSNNNPIPFANVLLYSLPDSVFIKGKITKNTGEFKFSDSLLVKNGFLEISHIAYKTEKITIGTKHSFLIYLKEDNINLEEIVVLRKKNAIEFNNGNLVANVSAIPNSQNYNISQLLKRLP